MVSTSNGQNEGHMRVPKQLNGYESFAASDNLY